MRPGKRATVPSINYISNKVQYKQNDSRGEVPRREQDIQIGRYIYLTGRKDSRAEDDAHEINYFTTGISLCPPKEYYIEIVALPELLKQGYMLPGPIIIGPDNNKELVVPLFKFRECEDLELPVRAVRMIVKPAIYAHLQQVKTLSSAKNVSREYGGETRSASAIYLPDPTSVYAPDMNAYNASVSSYREGVPRPHAAPPKGTHMF